MDRTVCVCVCIYIYIHTHHCDTFLDDEIQMLV
jgi:hypothetical protein